MEGSTVTIDASPDAGNIVRWGGACANASGNSCTVTMNANQSVTYSFQTATFAITLQTDGTGTGSISGATTGDTFNHGSTVKLTANAASDSTFAGWSGGGCSGTTNPCTVTMNAAKTVTATFKKNTSPPTDGVFFKDSFEKKTP